jgi:phosphoesterase RecJ-like protein
MSQAMPLIHSAHRIALLAHERPDGDCLGSALGLAHILRTQGKICVPICADPAPAVFSFLPGITDLRHSLNDEQYDLVIALDAGELSRYGAIYEQHRAFLDQATIINIDHHVSSLGCGQVNIIDTTAAATAELLVVFAQQANLPITADAALCLLTGIYTDTGSLQYASTTARTMQTAARLLAAGTTTEPIVKGIFRSHPLAQVRLQAAVVNNARTASNGRLIWSYATDETLALAGADPSVDANFAGMLRDIEGVQIAAFFKNYGSPSQTRLSLRTDEPYNAATFCMRYGGGGHARAAGATIDLPLTEAMQLIVAALEQELQQLP